MITEEEAAKKLCCNTTSTYCLGSECMAWQWAYKLYMPVTPPINLRPRRSHRIKTNEGYCGLVK